MEQLPQTTRRAVFADKKAIRQLVTEQNAEMGFEPDVKLVRQGQPRQAEAHAPGLGQCDSHVLDKVLDEEAWIEVVVHDPGTQIGQ